MAAALAGTAAEVVWFYASLALRDLRYEAKEHRTARRAFDRRAAADVLRNLWREFGAADAVDLVLRPLCLGAGLWAVGGAIGVLLGNCSPTSSSTDRYSASSTGGPPGRLRRRSCRTDSGPPGRRNCRSVASPNCICGWMPKRPTGPRFLPRRTLIDDPAVRRPIHGGAASAGDCAPPRPGFAEADPATWHYASQPELTRALSEHQDFVRLLSDAGAEVIGHDESLNGLADAIYVHDPVLVTDRGSILMRMGKPLRRGEEAAIGSRLEQAGVPVHYRLHGDALAEGGGLPLAG